MSLVSHRSCGDPVPKFPCSHYTRTSQVPALTTQSPSIPNSSPDMFNLFQLGPHQAGTPLAPWTYSACPLCSPDCRQAGGWYLTEMSPFYYFTMVLHLWGKAFRLIVENAFKFDKNVRNTAMKIASKKLRAPFSVYDL